MKSKLRTQFIHISDRGNFVLVNILKKKINNVLKKIIGSLAVWMNTHVAQKESKIDIFISLPNDIYLFSRL